MLTFTVLGGYCSLWFEHVLVLGQIVFWDCFRGYISFSGFDFAWETGAKFISRTVPNQLDCEQSLFFSSFSESNARVQERRSRETRETRAAAPAPSVTRVAICGSRVLLHGRQKKERLLVVYEPVRSEGKLPLISPPVISDHSYKSSSVISPPVKSPHPMASYKPFQLKAPPAISFPQL